MLNKTVLHTFMFYNYRITTNEMVIRTLKPLYFYFDAPLPFYRLD